MRALAPVALLRYEESLPRPFGTILRELWSLSWPVMGLNVLGVLALVVDAAMCGRLPNARDALAGLGYAGQLYFLCAVSVLGLSVGAVAMVARAYGAGDSGRVDRILSQASVLAVLLGLVVAVVGPLAARPLIGLLGAGGPAHQLGSEYLQILFAAAPAFFLGVLLAAALRGIGETRTAFVAALISNALNFVLNYGLILGNLGLPALGVRGAAIGTVISQFVNVALLIAAIRTFAVPGVHLRWPRPFVEWPIARQLFRIGWPAALDVTVINLAFLSLLAMLGRISDAAVAAHTVGLRLQALAFVPGLGVGQATAALVGQALGAGSEHGARQVSRASMFLCTTVTTVFGLAIVGGTEPILWLFDVPPDTVVGEYAATWMIILGVCMPMFGMNIAQANILNGAGATRMNLVINAVAFCGVQLLASYTLAFPLGLGATGAWLGFPVGAAAKFVAITVVYRGKRWVRLGASA